MARAHLHAGDHVIAETLATAPLATMTRLDSDHQQAKTHHTLTELAEQAGKHQRADEHRAATASLRSTHTPPEPVDTQAATDPPANPG